MQTLVSREKFTQWQIHVVAKRQSIGFVPTMGALHAGHISIVEKACRENDVVVVSIFVNPKQFNQSEDFQNYPRTLQTDLLLLSRFQNLVVFTPIENELFADDLHFKSMPLERIGQILEGEYRPGHFEGVVHVVHNLFALIKPHKAYFGQKDFQQLAIVKKINDFYHFNIQIIECETIREKEGLAMSSRNLNLSAEARKAALSIYAALKYVENQVLKDSIDEVKKKAIDIIVSAGLQVEYLEIVDPASLESCTKWQKSQVCCIAAYCQGVRLIDNMLCESVL